ncbi:hypothetical protein [Streptosporangium sp. NPDC002721]|uniref:effector-associated constant component EACC1 n=1 Tax=Streptosporangium sp. NPDC002721 TaxID=3366188 RepID=UPI0036C73B6D
MSDGNFVVSGEQPRDVVLGLPVDAVQYFMTILAAAGGPAGLATVLVTWLRHRKSRATLKMTDADGRVLEFDVQGAKDPTRLAQEVAHHLMMAQVVQAAAEDDTARAALVSEAVTRMLTSRDPDMATQIGQELMAVLVASAPAGELAAVLGKASEKEEHASGGGDVGRAK